MPLPLAYVAVPPELSDNVGVPPAVLTVTASLVFTVRVTTAPALSVPEPEVIPVPVATTDETVGAVESMENVSDAGAAVCGLPTASTCEALTATDPSPSELTSASVSTIPWFVPVPVTFLVTVAAVPVNVSVTAALASAVSETMPAASVASARLTGGVTPAAITMVGAIGAAVSLTKLKAGLIAPTLPA